MSSSLRDAGDFCGLESVRKANCSLVFPVKGTSSYGGRRTVWLFSRQTFTGRPDQQPTPNELQRVMFIITVLLDLTFT
jgi:hypothetical protein